ncbi:MAG: hypothetical protein ACM3Q0_07670, partial [Bacteroidota bacterium]
ITIPVAALPAPPGRTGANLKVIGNGNNYIVATAYSVRFSRSSAPAARAAVCTADADRGNPAAYSPSAAPGRRQ